MLILLVFGFVFSLMPKTITHAQIIEQNFVVYDEDENFLLERIGVVVGDEYIDKYFNKYQVYLVDEVKKEAKARFIETLPKPNITKKDKTQIDQWQTNKKIALYLTHNAESYIIGDGTDSFWGKGGIHDIAKKLKAELENKNIEIFLDETLHLPHDSGAYSRSRKTASALLKNKPDAIFDIHRDGVSRNTYAKITNGIEHSRVRIVVGQANANNDKNMQFALYLLSVAEVSYPWLFLDIYNAKGHYNQDLLEKALLFEMGTYTIEKDLVLKTVKPLADVINTTLYGTTVDTEGGELTIGGNTQTQNPTVNEVLSSEPTFASIIANFTTAAAFLTLVSILLFLTLKYFKNLKNN